MLISKTDLQKNSSMKNYKFLLWNGCVEMNSLRENFTKIVKYIVFYSFSKITKPTAHFRMIFHRQSSPINKLQANGLCSKHKHKHACRFYFILFSHLFPSFTSRRDIKNFIVVVVFLNASRKTYAKCQHSCVYVLQVYST